MKIETVLDEKEIDIGVSNISVEGEVTYTETPEHREGVSKKGKKEPYNFWSQWVVIDDGTGKIGCSISVKDENDGIEKGVIARVKGKLTEWEGKRKLQGKLIGISKGGKETDVQQEKAEEYFDEKANGIHLIKKEEEVKPEEKPKAKPEANVWEAKDLRIARECAIKAVTELVCAGIIKSDNGNKKIGEKFFKFADTLVNYIYNGNNGDPKKPTKADKIKKAQTIIKEHGKVEVKDEEQPFPDEEITDEDIPGSSYDNAHAYEGKRKSLGKAK